MELHNESFYYLIKSVQQRSVWRGKRCRIYLKKPKIEKEHDAPKREKLAWPEKREAFFQQRKASAIRFS